MNNDFLSALVDAVERSGANIAPTYHEYMPMAFAIANSCGEAGRTYFHRLCAPSPRYKAKDADRMYDNALKTGRNINTLGTVWHLAERAGVDLRDVREPAPSTHMSPSNLTPRSSATFSTTRREDPLGLPSAAGVQSSGNHPAGNPSNGNRQNGFPTGNAINPDDELLPSSDPTDRLNEIATTDTNDTNETTASTDPNSTNSTNSTCTTAPHTHARTLYTFDAYSWPEFVQQGLECGHGAPQRDVLLLSILTTLGATMADLTCFYYGHRRLHPTLQVFIIAPPASGKGAMGWAKQLAQPLHDKLKSTYEQSFAIYKHEHQKWVDLGKERATQDEPEAPQRRLFFIAGDNTGSGILENLVEQRGLGMISEPEASVLSAAINSDYGNWSSTLRKAFDHDGVSYNRKSDHEHRECPRTLLSVLISGTPGQLQPLIPSPENGLYSRVLFYHMPPITQWVSQFRGLDADYPALFHRWGERWMRLLDALRSQFSQLEFRLDSQQEQDFDRQFSQIFQHASESHSQEGRSAVARIAINVLRMMNIVALLRALDPLLMEPDEATFTRQTENLLPYLRARPLVQPMLGASAENQQDGIVSALTVGILPEDYAAVLQLSQVLYRHSTETLLLFPEAKQPQRPMTKKEQLLSMLPLRFTKQEAVRIGACIGFSERIIGTYLQRLTNNGTLQRIAQGEYQFSELHA